MRALLIQKDTKHWTNFEIVTMRLRALLIQKDTKPAERCADRVRSLRALLIQKDTKLAKDIWGRTERLRALLIQKDTKPNPHNRIHAVRLRALLIQKDTKHFSPSSKQRIDTISRYTSDQIRRKEHIKGEYSRLFYISCPVIWKSLFRSVFVHTES